MYISYESEQRPKGLQVGIPRGILCKIAPEKDHEPCIEILCRACRSQLENKLFINDMIEACKMLVDEKIFDINNG